MGAPIGNCNACKGWYGRSKAKKNITKHIVNRYGDYRPTAMKLMRKHSLIYKRWPGKITKSGKVIY